MSTTDINQRLDNIEKELESLRDTLTDLISEYEDHKEALEHTDDSLSNLRVTVSAIAPGEHNGNK